MPESLHLLRPLGDFARRLAQARRLDDLVWTLAESVGLDFGFPDCVIYLCDHRAEGQELYQAAAWGEKNPQPREIKDPIRIPFGEGITGTAAASATIQRVDDVRADPRYIADVYEGLSELAVPIVYADRVLGVIDSEADEVGYYGEREEALLSIIADMLAPRIAAALEEERRLRAETHLASSRARYRMLVDSIEGVVWEADRQNLGFRFLSRQLERLLGHPPEVWLHAFDEFVERIHPDDRDTALAVRRRVAASGEAEAAEYRLIGGDERVRWIRDVVSIGPADDGEPTLRGIMVDVTEQRIAHERALAASRAKDEFLSNVSHEMRTPLHAIGGLAELLSASEISSHQRRWVDVISSSVRSLTHLIDEVLDLARIESGRLRIDERPLEPRLLVDEVLAVAEALAGPKGLRVLKSVDPELPQTMVGDPARLRQILSNLLSNAVKFTPEGRVELAVGTQDGQVSFAVRDTGPGIPDEHLARIFDRFHQVDSSSGRSHRGVGASRPGDLQRARRADGREDRGEENVETGAEMVLTLRAVGAA